VADEAGPGAVATVDGAEFAHEKEGAVGVAVDESGDRHVAVLGEGIAVFAWVVGGFSRQWEHGSAERISGVVFGDQGGVIGGDADREAAFGMSEGLSLVRGQ